jgi:hypothetical protein
MNARYLHMWQRLKCLFGIHRWQTPIVAELDTYWLQAGRECKCCNKFAVSKTELGGLFPWVYQRGINTEHARMIAYAKGLDEIIKVYPNELERRGYTRTMH